MMQDDADMNMFKVVVAKRSSDSDIEDDDFQKTIKVYHSPYLILMFYKYKDIIS